MPVLTLLPSFRTGSWEFEGLSRREAHFAFNQFRASQTELREMLVSRVAGRLLDPAESAARHALLLKRGFFAVGTVVFACMAIESFLNYYGVRRFGPAFRERETEFLPARKKAALILSYTCSPPPQADATLFACLERLVDRRNELIHPKTHEHAVGVEPPACEPPPLIAEESIADMEHFFAQFAVLDPEAKPHMLA